MVELLHKFVAAMKHIEANPDAKRLYDDLLSNYNRLIRPVINHTETLTVWLSLKLSQLIEMNLKNQIMTTNLWVVQVCKLEAVTIFATFSRAMNDKVVTREVKIYNMAWRFCSVRCIITE